MKHQQSILPILTFLFALLVGNVQLAMSEDKPDVPPGPPPAPQVAREFRAAWIATVANIDWPSKPGLSEADQKAELTNIMELAAKLKLNAVVFQVRPACDAIYKSKLEPWSEFLSGEQGVGPKTYDPLEFICEEGFRLGIEIHAWFNPYRAIHSSAKSKLSKEHISKKNPAVVKTYGNYGWLDPGEQAAVEHTQKVVLDVVKRYDIAGVHFDDYFYPYPITEKNADGKEVPVPFPDDASWNTYLKKTPSAEHLSRDDWRRENVNQFIESIGKKIHEVKPHVRFGVSPFGIYRPGYPKTIQGFDQYDKLYADAKLWLEKGWVDYFSPQLYWPIDQKPQSFPVLLNWWSEHNPKERHLWPGLYTSKVKIGNPPWETREIINQIVTTREQRGASGHIHFSMKALTQDYNGIDEVLGKTVYADYALVPATPWLANADEKTLEAPLLKLLESGGCRIRLNSQDRRSDASWWVVHTLHEEQWKTVVLPISQENYKPLSDSQGNPPLKIVVNAVDELGREGMRAELSLVK